MAKSGVFRSRAQSTIEYSVLIAIVAAAVIGMQLYAQRAVSSTLKVIEDQLNAEPQ